jgi:hypothetical protein
MNKPEIKAKLIKTIESTQDEGLLQCLAESMELYQVDRDAILEVPEPVRRSIEKGLKQVENGQLFSQEESDAKVEKWVEGE